MRTKKGIGEVVAIFLICLIVLSKVSFRAIFSGFPSEVPFLVFQGGLHPYINVCLIGVGAFLLSFSKSEKFRYSPFYSLFLSALLILLGLQTSVQVFVGAAPVLASIALLLSSYLLILVYAWQVPRILGVERIGDLLFWSTAAGVWISILCYLFNPEMVWKGGRFIGVFKHIPHMVTCATVAFIFSLNLTKHKIFKLLTLPSSFYVLLLTGTRSALAACLCAVVMAFILFRTTSLARLFMKVSASIVAVTFLIFFGGHALDYVEGVITGERALMERAAQDGVESRMEEATRGWEMFEKSPWIGQGLASKFSSGDEVSIEKYSANKDPHNIFVSAGVIGGWPFLVLTVVALLMLVIASLRALANGSEHLRIIAIYLLVHLPILMIYHIHLSPGGVADRVYWLLFALVALLTGQKPGRGPIVGN